MRRMWKWRDLPEENPLLLEVETSPQPQQETSNVSLPGYPGEEERDSQENEHCYPQGNGNGNGNNEDPQLGCYHYQRTTDGVNGSRCPDAYDIRRCQQEEEYVARYASEEINHKKSAFSNHLKHKPPQKEEAYHVEEYVHQASMDEHIGYDGPWLMWEARCTQAKQGIYIFRPGQCDYENYEV